MPSSRGMTLERNGCPKGLFGEAGENLSLNQKLREYGKENRRAC